MPHRRPTAAQRRLVAARARDRCEYCGCPDDFSPQPFSVEHIVPVSRGGRTTVDNLALACQGCNNHKYARLSAIDPATGQDVPLYHPRQHSWAQHFAWSDDGLLLLGMSEIGRATVEALQLNRSRVVSLRRLLVLAGIHPPSLE